MVAEHLRTSRCTLADGDIAVLELKRTESSNYRNSDNFWGDNACNATPRLTDGHGQPQAMLGGARHRYVSVCRGFRVLTFCVHFTMIDDRRRYDLRAAQGWQLRQLPSHAYSHAQMGPASAASWPRHGFIHLPALSKALSTLLNASFRLASQPTRNSLPPCLERVFRRLQDLH